MTEEYVFRAVNMGDANTAIAIFIVKVKEKGIRMDSSLLPLLQYEVFRAL
jgi:hypothetical protein